jgi:hypothetical protein
MALDLAEESQNKRIEQEVRRDIAAWGYFALSPS